MSLTLGGQPISEPTRLEILEAFGLSDAAAQADRAATYAAVAESLVDKPYSDTASGILATNDGGSFAVDNGDGTVTIWRNSAEVATNPRTLSTTAYSEATYLKKATLESEAGSADVAYQLGLGQVRDPLIPTVCITFDYWPDAYDIAYGYMFSRSLVGTWFVDHRTIDNKETSGPLAPYNLDDFSTDGNGVSRNKLIELKSAGWTIGAYLGGYPVDTNSDGNIDTEWNMPTFLSEDRLLFMDYIMEIKTAFADKGLGDVGSAAPNQRAWDVRLERLMKGYFERVRVASQDVHCPLPITSPRYIDLGGVPSLDNGDTPASIVSRINSFVAQAQPGLMHLVIHKISDDGAGALEVSLATVIAALDRLGELRDAGDIRVGGYDQLSHA